MVNPLDRLRHHVTGAIERGEATPIVEIPATRETFQCADCGAVRLHPEYGAVVDGGQRVCYACCAVRDRAQMARGEPIVLYLTRGEVTNWPGTLTLAVRSRRVSDHNMAGRNGRTDVWFTAEGRDWHGVNIGDSHLLRCRPVKRR